MTENKQPSKASAASTTGGGVQHHSIFGWANEKAEKAVSETSLQTRRAVTDTYSKHAAGAKAPTAPAARKVSDAKVKGNNGHNIFAADPVRAPKEPTRRQQELKGNNIFGSSSPAATKRPTSAYKSRELSGSSGIFGDDGGSAQQSRPPAASLKVTQPAGGRSTFSFA